MSTQAKRIDTMTPLPVAQDDKVVMCGSGGVHTSTLEQLMKAVKANIKVGGRNYVRNSKGPFTEYQTELEVTDNFEGVNEYVISYDLEFENAQAGTAYNTCRIGVECMVFNADGTLNNYGDSYIIIKNGESGKYRVTKIFYLPYGKRLANKCHVNVQLLGADKAQISNVKIEKGNIPTDWSPAPEDIMGGVIYYTAIGPYLVAYKEKGGPHEHSESVGKRAGQLQSIKLARADGRSSDKAVCEFILKENGFVQSAERSEIQSGQFYGVGNVLLPCNQYRKRPVAKRVWVHTSCVLTQQELCSPNRDIWHVEDGNVYPQNGQRHMGFLDPVHQRPDANIATRKEVAA